MAEPDRNCALALRVLASSHHVSVTLSIYDTDAGADSQLANISTRGFVLTGGNVMIGGLVLGGANNSHLAVRGIGPSLASSV